MTLEELFDIVEERANASPDESWTARLLSQGPKNAPKNLAKKQLKPSSKLPKGTRPV